ncbi:unnamed protein product [Adineta steineri]|uniref:TIR domain-containing protein n=1 Tax=Adineta steineri TaxID=433720 RepID=A0A814TAU1_9BILA|nr:unnamed protein product [Adineta steineri]CAF1210520.1 unnamed protein product [Adineta steineri]
MSILISVIEKFTLSCTEDNEIGDDNDELYNFLFNYYISLDILNDYIQAIQQLDRTILNDNYKWLLFTGFNSIIDLNYYNNERRDILCKFWLSKYEWILKKLLLSSSKTSSLPLNGIKYLLTNIIRIQITIENITNHLMTQDIRFYNFNLKNEYLSIIKIILPLLINKKILNNIENDLNIQFNCDLNHYSNTKDIKSIYIIWIILKILLMFITTDEDCLIIIKSHQIIKNSLLKSIQLIKNNNSIKLSYYVILTFLINDNDIKNKINHPKEICNIFIRTILQINDFNNDDFTFTNNGVHIIHLLIALKAYLQHDQVKDDFIESDGLNLLLTIANSVLASTEIESQVNNMFGEKFKSIIRLIPTEECDLNVLQEINHLQINMQYNMNILFKEIGLLALECLYTMSFNRKAKEILQKNERFMIQIRELSNDENLKKIIDGLLWKLEDKYEFQIETTNQYDFMISYHWNDNVLVYKIFKYLIEKFNYKIWLDDQSISNSICQTIEKSKFILMCMSETYKTNENCRSIIEYAQYRKKIIIPLIIKQVELDSWFESICSENLYIDFVKQNFEDAIQLLINKINMKTIEQKEINSTMIDLSQQEISLSILPTTTTVNLHLNAIQDDYKRIPIKLWSDKHVEQFLHDNKLDLMILLTEYMNGEDLSQLFDKCQLQQKYWTIFDRFNNELKKRFQQTLSISIYVRFLNQIQKYINMSRV